MVNSLLGMIHSLLGVVIFLPAIRVCLSLVYCLSKAGHLLKDKQNLYNPHKRLHSQIEKVKRILSLEKVHSWG